MKLTVSAATLLGLLAGSAVAAEPTSTPPDLGTLISDSQRQANANRALNDIPKIRLDNIREAALGYGVRGGLARRSFEISHILANNQQMLDRIYNFTAMLLDKNVMPPVLSEAQNSLNQPDTDTIRVSDATYRIEQQARFVTVPTNWRDYLMRDFRYTVERPADMLLPQNDSEKQVWQQFVSEGWILGVQQANQIFDQSLSRLERDYKGMVLYRSLLAKGMISKPYVAEANMGVTGDSTSININDRILRITAKPRLETNPAIWKPIVAPK
ncbi:type IV secretory system conjugative DNA transfer family protein [Chromobacterium haemolyticum]|uniref:type IV secretory system conjugative DNA transfer family protein n=1 Tax=Chromobacterium haemolyticum TaxID=394935 RepID=UPI00244B1128|nr:type IV secretory system conjugative DNA transfer family protein [Chromobacterium haemolyticum]MDH0341972.1 type IV secretion system DotC family protein [Chromobacterium haemolyticum]